ncbi:MAG: ABC transporter permease subunit [Spirochaetaceae bacterium]
MIRLRISIGLFSILLFIAIFGPQLAPYSINYQENLRIKTIDDKEVYLYSPHKPDTEHVWGTNNWGYDLLTIILTGIRYTFIIALAGTIIRFLFGLVLGTTLSIKKDIPQIDITAFGSIPIFILAYFFLFRISMVPSLSINTLLTVQILTIALLGVPSTVTSIKKQTTIILNEGFIEAAYSCGASKRRIIFKHVLPLLYEKLMILFLTEMISILNIVGQFGIFNLFMGGTEISKDPSMYHSRSNELAGLIGQWRSNIHNSQWLLLYPLAVYLIILFIFHFLLSSMENYIRHKK